MISMYFDMDNVLANFDDKKDAVKRFKSEKGFFKSLKPIKHNITRLEYFYNLGNEIYILSASPHKRADNDKKEWLKKYLPFIKEENIIFCRLGQKKADFVKNVNDRNILIDDYDKNCREWVESGYVSYKVVYSGDDKKYPYWVEC